MSFLNPVNEPVKRFSSTDAGAPQINYNARTVGDIKAVLKACLVAGYGTKVSAGWSIANEVGNVCEFVSPSASMSDYRLGIDDSTATKTDWYYQYQDVKAALSKGAPTKSFYSITATSPLNGWELLVSERGLYFIELVYSTKAKGVVARVTYWGQNKSAMLSTIGENIAFWNTGYDGTASSLSLFLSAADTTNKNIKLDNYTAISFAGANIEMTARAANRANLSSVELTASMYLVYQNSLIGQQSGLLLKDCIDMPSQYGVRIFDVDARPVLQVVAGNATSVESAAINGARLFLIYLDYWEY